MGQELQPVWCKYAYTRFGCISKTHIDVPDEGRLRSWAVYRLFNLAPPDPSMADLEVLGLSLYMGSIQQGFEVFGYHISMF